MPTLRQYFDQYTNSGGYDASDPSDPTTLFSPGPVAQEPLVTIQPPTSSPGPVASQPFTPPPSTSPPSPAGSQPFNWGLQPGDSIDRYPSQVQQTIRRNYYERQTGVQAPGGGSPTQPGGPSYTSPGIGRYYWPDGQYRDYPPPSGSVTAAPQQQPSQQTNPYGTDYASAFFSLFPQGTRLTPSQLAAAAPQLARYGITPHTSASGVTQFVRLPDGTIIDVLQDAGDTSASLSRVVWQPTGPGSGYGGERGGSASEFTDPWGALMEKLTNQYIGALQNDPARNALTDYVKQLTEGQATARQRAQEFAGSLGGRVEQLRGPAYNEQQINALRTGATDAFERRRQETLKNEREKVYARGFEPTSGLVQGAEQEVNRNFEQGRTQIESGLLRDQIETTRANQQYADQLEAVIQNALSGGDMTALQFAATSADMENRIEQDRLARQREAISATGGPLGLINQRLGSAQQTLAGSSPSSAIDSFLRLMNQQSYQGQIDSTNRNAQWQGIAQLLDIFLGGDR